MAIKIRFYIKYNYFLDGDAADNVTSQLKIFRFLLKTHCVGMGDDIMYHILVDELWLVWSYYRWVEHDLWQAAKI